jgi:hypothetical protein
MRSGIYDEIQGNIIENISVKIFKQGKYSLFIPSLFLSILNLHGTRRNILIHIHIFSRGIL